MGVKTLNNSLDCSAHSKLLYPGTPWDTYFLSPRGQFSKIWNFEKFSATSRNPPLGWWCCLPPKVQYLSESSGPPSADAIRGCDRILRTKFLNYKDLYLTSVHSPPCSGCWSGPINGFLRTRWDEIRASAYLNQRQPNYKGLHFINS